MQSKSLFDGFNKKVEVPSNDCDDEEIESEGGRPNLCRCEVNDDGRGHSNPHLTDYVGGNECEKTPWVGEKEGTSCKWSSCYLHGGRREGGREGGREEEGREEGREEERREEGRVSGL